DRRQADTQTEEIHHRGAETRHEDRPQVAAHAFDPVLGNIEGAPTARPARGLLGGVGTEPLTRLVLHWVTYLVMHWGTCHSIRLRPVRRKNTSSRLERRTRDVTGAKP